MHPVSAVNFILQLSLCYVRFCNSIGYPIDINDMRANSDIPSTSNNPVLYFKQPLDHFNPLENRTFDMNYYQRLDMWKPNGPIYLWLETISFWFLYRNKLNDDGALPVMLAKETNGALYLTDQRYSHFINLPHDKNFFKYLNTTQSLADIAKFIKFIKSDPKLKSSKVVIIGLQDEGARATWFRMLYPELVDAVVAVSAPLLAKKDFKEFFDIVHYVYDKYGTEDCIENMKYYFHTLGELFNNDTGIDTLKTLFNVCPWQNFTNIIDRKFFMESQYYPYHHTAQYRDQDSIKINCDITPSPVLKMSPSDWCDTFNISANIHKFWQLPGLYQQCMAFGRFPTTTSEKTPFVYWNPLEYFVELCEMFFGIDEKRIDEGIAETNLMFGGLTPNVTNVVFTWGDMDPYRLLGVQRNLSESAPVFVIDGVSTYNVLFSSKNEPKQLTDSRNRVKSLIKTWINSP